MQNLIKFARGTTEAYKNLETKDPNTLYFLNNGDLYKGDKSYTNSVIMISDENDFPIDPVTGKIYYKEATDEAKFWNGVEWKSINHKIDNILNDEKTINNPVTGEAIKTYFSEKLKNISDQGIPSNVQISTKEGNKLTQESDGLYASSGLDITEDSAENIVISNGDGTVKTTGVHSGNESFNANPDKNTLATEIAVKNEFTKFNQSIDTKLEEYKTNVNNNVQNIVDNSLQWEEL